MPRGSLEGRCTSWGRPSRPLKAAPDPSPTRRCLSVCLLHVQERRADLESSSLAERVCFATAAAAPVGACRGEADHAARARAARARATALVTADALMPATRVVGTQAASLPPAASASAQHPAALLLAAAASARRDQQRSGLTRSAVHHRHCPASRCVPPATRRDVPITVDPSA